MIKALIADDEEIIRGGIAKLLEKDTEITVAYQAEDGEMALQMAKEHLPDLLLVDINMPFMNGFEYINAVYEFLPEAAIVVISGYDDFLYAQKALKLGVFEYLLKPVMEEPFYDCINRAKEHIKQNKSRARYLQWAQQQLKKNRPTLLAGFLDGWLRGAYTDTEILQQMEYLKIDIPIPFGITLAHLSPDEQGILAPDRWDENLLYYAAENIAKEIFETLAPITICKTRSGDLVMLSTSVPDELFEALGKKFEHLLREHLPLSPLLMQKACASFEEMPQIYQDMVKKITASKQWPTAIQKAVSYIELHYSNSDINLQRVAEEAFVSPQHLSRLFRQEIRLTFVEYITQIRIRKATELLHNKDIKMYEVAERVGYASQHYFSSAFKHVLGISPNDYRKRILGLTG